VTYLLTLTLIQGLVKFLTPIGLPTVEEEEELEEDEYLITELP
jgi:hypothetical protein